MRYLGGKSKIAKRLATIIGGGDLLIEPFCGGGAMTAALAPAFQTVEASDSSEDLILLWQALQDGWVPPTEVSSAQYTKLARAEPSALRGFAGFGTSWGGKWFGGLARGGKRNYADESRRSLLSDVSKMKNVHFAVCDYRNLWVPEGSVVYADPPYAEATGYGAQFDNAEFWQIAEGWATGGAKVFVSEYSAPSNWRIVWEVVRTRDMRSDMISAKKVTERLFTLDGGGAGF